MHIPGRHCSPRHSFRREICARYLSLALIAPLLPPWTVIAQATSPHPAESHDTPAAASAPSNPTGMTKAFVFSREGEHHRMTMAWREPVRVTAIDWLDALLLTFSHSLEPGHLEDLADLPDWMGMLQTGYNTILLRPRMEKPAYTVQEGSTQITVEMRETLPPHRTGQKPHQPSLSVVPPVIPQPLPPATTQKSAITGSPSETVTLPAIELEAVSYLQEDGRHRLTLAWPGPVRVTSIDWSDGLLLTFSQPFAASHFAAFATVPAWMESFQTGYDTVLLRPRMGNPAYTVREGGTRVVVEMQETPLQKTLVLPARRPSEEVRMETIRARQMLETDEEMGALAIAQALLAYHPNNLDGSLVRPLAEERLGRWRQAVVHYNRMLAHFPNEPDVVRAKAGLLLAHPSHVRVTQTMERVKNGEGIVLNKWDGRHHLADRVDVAWMFQTRLLSSPGMRHADGTLTSENSSRMQGAMEWIVDHDDRDISRVGLLGGADRLGGRLSHTFADRFGLTTLTATGNETWWNTQEGHAGNAARHHLGLRRDHVFGTRTTGFAEIGYNQYDLAYLDRAASSVPATLGIQYALPWSEPSLTVVGYRMDGEYLAETETRRDAQDVAYQPFPIVNREVHSMALSVDHDLTDYLRWELGSELGWNRLESGLVYQARTGLSWSPLLDWALTMSVGQGNTVGQAQTTRVDKGEVALKMLY
ncbi:MAG: hypothetical protein H7839_10240 [Magnetococcus sp. YQC-5]